MGGKYRARLWRLGGGIRLAVAATEDDQQSQGREKTQGERGHGGLRGNQWAKNYGHNFLRILWSKYKLIQPPDDPHAQYPGALTQLVVFIGGPDGTRRSLDPIDHPRSWRYRAGAGGAAGFGLDGVVGVCRGFWPGAVGVRAAVGSHRPPPGIARRVGAVWGGDLVDAVGQRYSSVYCGSRTARPGRLRGAGVGAHGGAGCGRPKRGRHWR